MPKSKPSRANCSKNFFNKLHLLAVITLLSLALSGPSNRALAEELNFTILHTSDEHSSLMPAPLSDYLPGQTCPAIGGFARLATLVRQIRQQKASEPVLLLSSGDFSGATPFSWITLKGFSPEIELMHKTGYALTNMGNHEFDYGPAILAEYFLRHQHKFATPQIISSNLVIPGESPFNRVKTNSNLIITLDNGLKIGIFALLGKGAHQLAPAARPLDFSDQHTAARREIASLKAAGANVIAALTHAGYYEDLDLAESVDGIHLILGGHDHIGLDPPKQIGETILMHSGSYLQSAGQLDLAFERNTGKLRLRNHETASPFLHQLDSSIAEDPVIAAVVNQHIEELNGIIASFTGGALADMRAPIAFASFPIIKHQRLCETAVGNFVTDAIRLETAKVTGQHVDFVIHANGIIRGDIQPSTLPESAGKITLFDLITTGGLGSGADGEPGYPLVSFYLNGAEVLNMLEVAVLLPILWNDTYFLQVSGLRYHYDHDRAFWFRIPFINKPLPAYQAVARAERFTGSGPQQGDEFVPITTADNRLYHVVTTHYLASYLPMVGKKLPRLNITLKDMHGNPTTIDQAIIRLENRQFKLWEATARYAQSFPVGPAGLPVIPDSYRDHGNRIIYVKGQSLWLWPGIFTVLACMAIFFLLRRRHQNRRQS